MLDLAGFILLTLLGSILTALLHSPKRSWRHWFAEPRTAVLKLESTWGHDEVTDNTTNAQTLLQDIKNLAECHETPALLSDLIYKDGAGEWPPRSNHATTTWPTALRAYREIYEEMAPLLPTATVSLDDEVNRLRIANFRSHFRKLLHERVDLAQVEVLLKAAEAGQWDVFPRDTYNGFYSCIAWCRHAYRYVLCGTAPLATAFLTPSTRWATIPVVRVAQLEKTIRLPPSLHLPWTYLQRHFGLTSQSGNNMSNLVLNFSPSATYALHINTGLSETITSSEESFARIFHDVEVLALPIYHAVVHSLLSFARRDLPATLLHTRRVTACLRPLLSSYYDRVHDARIARSAWLSHVQGFYAWGVGEERDDDKEEGGWVKFDGLSGNQVLLFQVLDAFLGLEPYLDEENRRRNVPERQRLFCDAVARHSFRRQLGEDGVEGRVRAELVEIVKRLRVRFISFLFLLLGTSGLANAGMFC